MEITLFGSGTSRSSRCKWTLLELGVEFEYIEGDSLIGSEELKKMHPLGKLPAILIDGKAYFESAAICSHLCDLHPAANLIASPGTHERALHSQWCSFALTEIEAYLWSSFKNQKLYPAEIRIAEIVPNNTLEIRNGLEAIDKGLDGYRYLTGDSFSVTDIVVGFTLNWAKNAGHLQSFTNLSEYLQRLLERDLCTFKGA